MTRVMAGPPTGVPARQVRRKLRPLIAALKAEGRRNYATVNIPKIAQIAAQLQAHLDAWKARS